MRIETLSTVIHVIHGLSHEEAAARGRFGQDTLVLVVSPTAASRLGAPTSTLMLRTESTLPSQLRKLSRVSLDAQRCTTFG